MTRCYKMYQLFFLCATNVGHSYVSEEACFFTIAASYSLK